MQEAAGRARRDGPEHGRQRAAEAGLRASRGSFEQISKLLYSKDIEKESLELFIKLIENCEFARFTPASDVKINNDYENAVKVITKIDKEI